MSAAQKLKESGTLLYNKGDLIAAICLFQQAADLEPDVPVYFSNLSAAQYEAGQYAEAFRTCSSVLAKLPDDSVLRPKILARKAKALAFLSHDDISYSSAAFEACLGDGQRQNALKRQAGMRDQISLVNKRIVSIPRYRQCPKTILEYYVVGHDHVKSIFRAQSQADGQVEDHLHMKMTEHSSFSALYCGIGDARNMYGSLIDLGQELANTRPQNLDIHFTLVDIHPTALARDLVVLFALKELSTLSQQSSKRAKQILVMLHYTYWAAVMPPYAERTLCAFVDEVYDQVDSAVAQGSGLELGWLYIEAKSCMKILQSLEWWRTDGKTILTFDEALPDLSSDSELTFKAAKRSRYTEFLSTTMNDPQARLELEEACRARNQSPDELIAFMTSLDADKFGEMLDKRTHVPVTALAEHALYPSLRVLVPPEDCDEPKILEDTVFRPIRAQDFLPSDQVARDAFQNHIRSRWKVNYTKLDQHWIQSRDRGEQDPFSGCRGLFVDALEQLKPTESPGLFNMSAQFFWLAALGLGKVGQSLTIEVVVGDGFGLMDEIRLKTLPRPDTFPVLFDRIHGSNVPDYIGGHFAIFTTAMHLLKSHDQAYFTTCNLLNSSIWDGGMTQYERGIESQIYTYTGAVTSEITAAFGIEHGPGQALTVVDYHTLRRLSNVSNLLLRDDFLFISTSCFWRTVLPSKYSNLSSPVMQVREPQNVHAFFRALETWKNIGYPHHILSDLVERILENRLDRSSQPLEISPAPVSGRKRPLVSLCTIPFQAEFEVAAAIWEPRLFPIVSALLPSTADICRYSVKIPLEYVFALHRVASTHMVLMLAFGLPKDLDAPSMDLRSQIVGSSKRWTSTIQLVSTFEYDTNKSICTLLLAKNRLSTFVKEGYEVGLVNIAGWKIQSQKVPCSKMKLVGDLDTWDQSIKIPKVHGRNLTANQERAWMSELRL